MNRSFWLLLVVSALFVSCNSNEIGNSKDVNPETIWFDYKVWGEEGDEDITVMLQFRYAGPNGTTLLLEDPSKVELDGEFIKADSSKMTGAFYEMLKPVSAFHGKHSIVFTDINKKQYKEEFRFSPVSLLTEVPAEIPRGDLVFELEGLEPVDYVRVLLTDTSYTSDGINRVDTVKNGKLVIPKADLKGLVNGPIHLELIKEDERRVKNGTPEGGVLSISYALRREFLLKD
ncbi:MAG TPA: hypothetical protein VF476_14945 [Chitinophagaceae bacterium]